MYVYNFLQFLWLPLDKKIQINVALPSKQLSPAVPSGLVCYIFLTFTINFNSFSLLIVFT